MSKTKILFAALIFFSIAFSASAHQPRIVEQKEINIKNPEVSQAFYGELTGEPHVYFIEEDQPFKLYVGILVPELPDVDTDYVVEIIQQNTEEPFYSLLDGQDYNWISFYEEFGGDYYLEGPELKDTGYKGELPKGIDADPGKYKITVSSTDDQGKYVLVVGEKEEFPPSEMWNTVKTLPTLKSVFFEKSAWSAFNNRIGLYMLPLIIIILLIIFLVIYFIIKKIKK